MDESYLKYSFFRPLGEPRGYYRVGPLARLNVASRMTTPAAQKEFEVFKSSQENQEGRMKTLVIGYGNSMRKDDGIGPWVAEQLMAQALPDVDARVCHQLKVELADEFADYDRVIFIDAGRDGDSFRFRPLEETAIPSGGESHFLSPSLLQGLARQLFSAVPDMYLCTIRGEDFGLGEGFTLDTSINGEEALQYISKILTKETLYA